jgi:dynein heavy chain
MWNDKEMEKSNVANYYLYLWVEAMVTFHDVFESTKPVRERLIEVSKVLAEKTEFLAKKKADLEASTARLKQLEEEFNAKITFKEDLIRKINECNLKLERASKLTYLLADEKVRWAAEIVTISANKLLVPGDSLIAAGMVAYAGPFISEFRNELEEGWVRTLTEVGLEHSPNIRMSSYLGDPVKILAWNICGLPKDDTSIENGIIIDKTRRWPLMIDPQTQANKYIRKLGSDVPEGMDVIKASSGQLIRQIEQGIQFGKWILVENIGTHLDPALEPILLQQVVKIGGSKTIVLGDKSIPYSDSFKFFMTSTNPNPHYSPEISAKVTIINFGITPLGLEEQMLALVVIMESPEVEKKKSEIVRTNAADKKKLQDIEDVILKSLSDSQGDILMDESLINGLAQSKKTSAEINIRMEESKVAEIKIDEARESYRPVAFNTSLLYFCIADLTGIDPMYQYSLQWFESLFKMGIENAAAHTDISIRLTNLNTYFQYSLYENVCRSLFGRHKLLFSFLLSIKMMQGYKELDAKEFRYLLTGYPGEVNTIKCPVDWISENAWNEIYKSFYGLDKLETYSGILADFTEGIDEWKVIYDAAEPQDLELPRGWSDRLSPFQRILVINGIRQDKVKETIQNFVIARLGQEFVNVPVFKLNQVFKDSNCVTP